MENRKYFGKWTISAVVAAALCSMTSSAFAGPALYWMHPTIKISTSTCATRAQAAMASEKVPVKDKGSNFATGWNNNVTTTIKCFKKGNDSMAVITVTSNDANYAKYLVDVFNRGMKSGLFE